MVIQMIKHNGKMVPAKQEADGKWVPMEDKELVYTGDGIEVRDKKE